MFEKNNLYVLNKKDQEAIVYRDSLGKLTRITSDMFSTKEEFEHWKAWSDEDYHCEEIERHSFSDKTLYIEGLSEEALSSESAEEVLLTALSEEEQAEMIRSLLKQFNSWLTETARRRMWLHYGEGKTIREIAKMEGVSMQSVDESIISGKEKFLKKFAKTP